MCEIFDEIRNMGRMEGELKGQAKMAKRLMEKNSITFEETMELLGISEDEQQKLRKYMYS